MGALPKKRISRERQGKRRSVIKLNLRALVKCKNCGKLQLPHQVCANCGYYKGTLVKKVEERTKVKKVEV